MSNPKFGLHRIDRKWCKGCGICVESCAKKVLELYREGNSVPVGTKDCIVCRLCEMRCPDLAIEIIEEEAGDGAAV